jgi:hypothetical protein
MTDEKTLCHIIGGFHNVYSTEDRYKLAMSLLIIKETKLSIPEEDGDYDSVDLFK